MFKASQVSQFEFIVNNNFYGADPSKHDYTGYGSHVSGDSITCVLIISRQHHRICDSSPRFIKTVVHVLHFLERIKVRTPPSASYTTKITKYHTMSVLKCVDEEFRNEIKSLRVPDDLKPVQGQENLMHEENETAQGRYRELLRKTVIQIHTNSKPFY